MAAQRQDFVTHSCVHTSTVTSKNHVHRVYGALLMLSLIACSLLVSVHSQAGQYYKWVDDKGVTHFSEKPVPGADAKKMTNTAKNSQVSEEPEATPQSDPKSQSQEAAPPSATAATPQAQSELEKNCKIAHDRLKALQSGQRIRLTGPDGKFTYLDENQIKAETVKTQEVLNSQCGK